jgi:hypothetical protein
MSQPKALRLHLIDFPDKSEVIALVKSCWIAAKVASHTWLGVWANYQELPRTTRESIYAAQIEITKTANRKGSTEQQDQDRQIS